MLPGRTTVLIIGAGPSGLAAAVSLLQQGCRDVLIVDAVDGDSRLMSSRAIVVHAATLEALETIGCAESLVAMGLKRKDVEVYTGDGLFMQMSFDSLNSYTRYPHGLLASQYSTERVLEKRLEEMGLTVQRPYKLVSLDDGADEGLVATFESGERVNANYVIGADGAKSVVRQMVKVDYADPSAKPYGGRGMQAVTADITLKTPLSLSRDEVVVRSLRENYFISVPVPKSPWPESYDHLEDGIFRIAFCVPNEDIPPPSPSIEYFQKHLDELRPLCFDSTGSKDLQPIQIDKVLWSTRFRVQAAIADKFFVRVHSPGQEDTCRVVFLVGDAAHTHPPVGGQGMNLGLRDAIGLAPVIVKHMEMYANGAQEADKIMEEYALLRRARALNTIELTKRTMSWLFFLESSRWVRYLLWMVKLAMRIPVIQRMWPWRASGLGNR